MYDFYIDGTMLPVSPPKLEIKTAGKNKTVSLINEGEVNLIKTPGLQEVSFEALLPNQRYPFARYPDGFHRAGYYKELFEGLANSGEPFQFIVARRLPAGKKLDGTNLRVTIEDMTVTEDAKNGTDAEAKLKLKEYREYGTKTVVIDLFGAAAAGAPRMAENAPAAAGNEYVVQKGDSLWKIAKHFYGDGAAWKKIADANKGTVSNPNKIYPGQKLAIPPKEG